MTIYFYGNSFKYEMENIARLFFPLRRFQYEYDPAEPPQGDSIQIGVQETEAAVQLWVMVRQGSYERQKEDRLAHNEEKISYEMALARLLYRILEELTGISPQWGVLTGIRPVKWMQRRLQKGATTEEIAREFREELFVQEEKIKLSLQIATVQQELLAEEHPRDYSLYLSIPYCPSRCSYCSFVSSAVSQPKILQSVPKYLNLLIKELETTAEIAARNELRLRTVYIGGGTPTTLSAPQLKRLTDAISATFPLTKEMEYTIEAGRPDTITVEKLAVIRESGCNRISINPQTFSDTVLTEIGRKHTAKDAEDCYLMAREMGFSSINMDFIAGLPGDDYEGFCRSIDYAVSLSPENITVHTLSIKRASTLFEQGDEDGDYRVNQRMVEYAYRALTAAGYMPYYLYRQKNTVGNLENVGYAKAGHFGRYNVYIMDEMQTILACGAGAVTKIVYPRGIDRFYNFKYPTEYIEHFSDILTKRQQAEEILKKHLAE